MIAAGLLFSCEPALANEWFTKTEEDVFSGKNTAVMFGGSNPAGSIYVDCDADRGVAISFIFPFDGEIDTNLRGVIVVKVDDAETLRYEASAYPHNDKYGGFKAELKEDEKALLLKSIASSKRKVLTGLAVEAIDFKQSVEISARGSSKAAAQFMKACEIL